MRTARLGRHPLMDSLRKEARHYQLYLMVLLPVAFILIFAYAPMWGAQIAFRDYTARGGILGSPWVGLKQFTKFFTSYQFGRVVTNTLALSAYGLIAGFPVPILLALSLNSTRNRRFKKTVQMATYAPYFISLVVLVSMMNQLFSLNYGIVNVFLRALGLQEVSFLGNAGYFRSLYVWSGVWQEAGWGSIIYISALSAIDPSLHEAAIVDGAGRLRRIWHIDLPGIRPTMIVLLIMSAGNIMNVGFEKVLLMNNSVNQNVSQTISLYLYSVSLQAKLPNYSYATAIGLFNSVINFALILVVNGIARRLSEFSLW